MIFNELTYYLLFLGPSVLTFHGLSRVAAFDRVRARSLSLSVFGVLFFVYYAYVHFGGWKGSLAVGIFVWELLTSQLYKAGSRWCIFGIVQAVAILVGFKYLWFFSSVAVDLGLASSPIARVVLPLGVSFFTFEFIHFAADSYRGLVQRRPPWTYAAFIFFFPTMVAGPIKRYDQFEPELTHAQFEGGLFAQGITRILAGLAKKHALADTFTIWSDRLNTDALHSASGPTVAGWILAYGMKIYLDFSAYSDIAIGSGYLFGIRIPENFDWPYASKSISEFWRRWHISLGRWIFDYIYAPLGGSRRGPGRTALNLVAAFAISGLWHGAAYNFVLWGLWHGLMVLVHRAWRASGRSMTGPVGSAVALALTFLGVHIGWAFFCMDAKRAVFALGRVAGLH